MPRSLQLALAVGLALAAAAAASAGVLTTRVEGSQSFELKYGTGYAVVGTQGATLGKVRRGTIRVVNVPGGGAPSGFVRGCEARSGRLSGTLTCRGRYLSFYVHGGTWRVRLRGRGINVSGVVRGSLGLDRADGGTGLYSIGDAPFRRWPATFTFFKLES
jgi:hypothetical protein